MKTIKNITFSEWDEFDYNEKLNVAINTMFLAEKINVREKITIGDDYGEAIIELNCIEEDEKLALTEGWIQIKDGPYFELNLWRENAGHYWLSDNFWSDLHSYLQNIGNDL